MKKLMFFSLVLSIFLVGCGKGATSQMNESDNSNSVYGQVPATYLSRMTECSREENPELYDAMQKLLADRAEMQFMLASPDIDINSEDTIETADGLVYYPLKDEILSKETLRNQLLEIYENNYIDRVLFQYHFDTAKHYMEQEGRLYGLDLGVVITTLKEDWAILEVNPNYYYLVGYEDIETKDMAVLTIVRSADGEGYWICDELEINFVN